MFKKINISLFGRYRVEISVIYILLSFFIVYNLQAIYSDPWLIQLLVLGTVVVFFLRNHIFNSLFQLKKYFSLPQLSLTFFICFFAAFSFSFSEVFFTPSLVIVNLSRVMIFLAITLWFYPWVLLVLCALENFSIQWQSEKDYSKNSLTRVWLSCFSIMFIVWFFYLVAMNPAGLSSDSFDVISQGNGQQQLSAGHPLPYTLLVSFFWSIYPSPSLIAIFQIFIFSALTASFLTLLVKKNLKVKVAYLAAFLFSLWPSNGLMVISIWKDVLFTFSIFATTFFLIQMLLDNSLFSKSWLKVFLFSGSLSLMILTRHNGVLAFWLVLILVLLFYWRNWTAQVLTALIVPIIFTFWFSHWLYPHMGVINDVGHAKYVPIIHAIGGVIAHDADLPTDIYQLALSIAPLSVWREQYNAYTIGTYHYGPLVSKYGIYYKFANQSLFEAINQYWRSFMASPREIVRNRLNLSSINWEAVTPSQAYIYRDPGQIEENIFNIKQSKNFMTIFVNNIRALSIHLDPVFWRVGISVVVILVAAQFLLVSYNWRSLIIFTPWLGNFLFLMIVNIAQDYRYVWFSSVMAFVLVLTSITLCFNKNKIKSI